MECVRCEQNPCTCGKRVVQFPIKQTHQVRPSGITKEEFGLDLYECVKAIGGLMQVDRLIAHAKQEGLGWQVKELSGRRAKLIDTIHIHNKALSDGDAAEVARRYPVVLGL